MVVQRLGKGRGSKLTSTEVDFSLSYHIRQEQEIWSSCPGRNSGDVLYSAKLPIGFLLSVLNRQKFVVLRI